MISAQLTLDAFSGFLSTVQERQEGRSSCAMETCVSLPGLCAGAVVPLLKEQSGITLVGTGASRL